MANYVSAHTGEQIDNGVDIALNNVITKDNTTSFTPSGDYNPATKKYVDDALAELDNEKQALLVSGTNIKTVNGTSVLGSGDIEIIGVEDGDKGDVTVTDAGETWTINNGVVSNSKLSNMAANTIKGKKYMVGEPEDLSPSEVRDMINVEDGAQVNNIIEVDVLPTPGAAYLDKIYKVKDKLFTIKSVMSIVRRNILVGDNLSGKRVYCSYPDNFYLQIYEYSEGYGGIFIDTTSGYYIFEGASTIIDEEEMIYHWCIEVNGWEGREWIYSWDTQTDSLLYNNEYIDSYKGIVTSIDTYNPAYQYMEIDDEEYSYEWKEYGGATELEKAINEDLYYKSGDVFKITNKVPLVAYVTTSTTRLYISIPVEKSLANISSIVCNSFQAEIRGITGYLNSESGFNEYVSKPDYTITCNKGTDNIIQVVLQKSTAWTNTSNNTPVIVTLNESSSFSFI